ncbi:phage tail protein [Pseudomonas japonica]|uniref:phage tail protein n=1 Tax=Pseudomonas japonica TaxID=256466 RepID=UPI003A8BFF5F
MTTTANSQFFAILTAVGEAKQANANALGVPWTFSAMGVGDANGADPVPSRAQTSLIAERRRAPLNQVKIDPGNASMIVAEQIIPPDVGGWWIREIGLYDAEGDLVAVANCAPSFKPLLSQGTGKTQVVRLNIIVTSTANVQLKIDPAVVLATREYVDGSIVNVLPRNKAPGVYTQVQINERGVVQQGFNPTTLQGYGITDAFSKNGGEIDGPVTLLKARSIFLRGGQTESFASGLVALSDTDQVQGGSGFWGGQAGGFTRAYLALGPTPWANGLGIRVDREAGIEVAGPVKFTGVLDGNGAKLSNIPWAGLADHPTTLQGYGIVDALPKSGGEITGNLYLNSARNIMLRGAGTESFASGFIALTDTDQVQGGVGFWGGLSAGFTRAYLALGATPWANGNGIRVTAAGVELSGAVTLTGKISGDGSGLNGLSLPFSAVTGTPTTLAGYGVPMASQTDAENGSESNKPMSALRVFQAIAARVVQATESVLGIARIATQLQVNGGADGLTIVTPKTLRFGFYAQFDSNGCICFPSWLGGWIVQWGLGSQIEAGQTKTISYPIAYPNRHLWTGSGNSFASGSTAMTSTTGVAYGTNEWFTVSAAGSSGQLNVPWLSFGR